MATDSKLESMPTELKIALLERVPDINTLSALVHASPIFHAVYLANREDILTETTLQELSSRDQTLSIDELVKPAALCNIVTKNGELDLNLEPAIISCQAQAQAQARANGGKICITLSVDHCIALRTLLSYYGWQIARSLNSGPDQHLLIYTINGRTYEEWSDPIRDCFVHVLVLGDYDPGLICHSGSPMLGIGSAPDTWSRALLRPHYPAATRTGRVRVSEHGLPVRMAWEGQSGVALGP